MRRYLTLVFLVVLAIPAGISFSGCTRNPAGNYCNGLGLRIERYGVYAIDLEPKTTGVSMAFGQTRQINAPTATTCKGTDASAGSLRLRHHKQPAGRYQPDRQHVRRHVESQLGRRHPGLHDLQPSAILFPTPAGCLTRTAYISASANSVTSNPVEVYVHAQVSSVSLATSGITAGAQQCYSQGVSAQLDSEACFALGGKQYEFCAPSTVTQLFLPGRIASGRHFGPQLLHTRSAR